MKNVRGQIVLEIKKAVKELIGLDLGISLDRPKDEGHGDYSANIALAIFANSEFRVHNSEFKSPLDLAKKIAELLNTKYLIHDTDRIEAVAPGFINFWLSEKYLLENIKSVLEEKGKYGASEKDKNKKIIVEFTDPNPFKEFHIGHLYSNVVGESISRLLEVMGANLKRANYQGDVGMHIAKSLYAILQISNLKSQISNLENKSAKERAEFLGQYYTLGAKVYEENDSAKKEIGELNKKIYDKDPAVAVLYEKGRQWSLEYFETIYKRLGTKFDYYYFESEVGFEGLELVREYLRKGVFEESQGAVIFPGKRYGLHDRVFINSLGLPTYEAKELSLAPTKYKDFKYDQSIIVTGNEISEYFKVLLEALKQIYPDLAAKTKHIGHGMVRLPTGKMSSRTGNVITGEWLIDEAKKLIASQYPDMNNESLEKVSIGAVKYALLKIGVGRDMEFDFNESISFEGNSGPYLQYTYARTQSVLNKVKSQKSKVKNKTQNSKLKFSLARSHLAKLEQEEVSLLRIVQRFSETVEEAGESFAPNLLCNYLFDLAQKFNLFYQKHKILQSRIESQRDFRLALTQAVGQVIKNGLFLLGISAPERM